MAAVYGYATDTADTGYAAHIFIQNHLNFLDPARIGGAIEKIIRLPTGNVACLFGETTKVSQTICDKIHL